MRGKHPLILPVLALALALVPAGTAFAQGSVGSVDESASGERAALEQIEEFTKQAMSTGEIPTTGILDRVGDEWVPEYDGIGEFKTTKAVTTWFITAGLAGDEWHRANAENHLRIYNFETITGAVGDGFELTLLVSELHKLQGRYDASGPVKKFHGWLAAKYSVPESERDIAGRLVEMLGDEKFLPLAEKAAQSFNDLVDNGSAPVEMIKSDMRYWLSTIRINMCEHERDCDLKPLQEYRDGTGMADGASRTDVASGPAWDLLVSEAYAASPRYIPYALAVHVSASSCVDDYNMCIGSAAKRISRGSGQVEVLRIERPPGSQEIELYIHSSGGLLTVFGSACSTKNPTTNSYDGISINVRTIPLIAEKPQDSSSRDSRGSDTRCAYATAHHEIREGSYTTFGGRVSSTGSYYVG